MNKPRKMYNTIRAYGGSATLRLLKRCGLTDDDVFGIASKYDKVFHIDNKKPSKGGRSSIIVTTLTDDFNPSDKMCNEPVKHPKRTYCVDRLHIGPLSFMLNRDDGSIMIYNRKINNTAVILDKGDEDNLVSVINEWLIKKLNGVNHVA